MFGSALIGIFQKMRIKKSDGGSGNVEIPPHPQLFAQRAPEG